MTCENLRVLPLASRAQHKKETSTHRKNYINYKLIYIRSVYSAFRFYDFQFEAIPKCTGKMGEMVFKNFQVSENP
ncbi:CLUMA_CG021101, isoform A [Clunio marinus]|uniref:CLUMA_CG021101, isoform A n=1 Tax=Clunio marinus TaxID=568069 RepID=A0A1J1J893_9DIPT|nr:CLUMA_CG021101, isoform A [Clunio marinus]